MDMDEKQRVDLRVSDTVDDKTKEVAPVPAENLSDKTQPVEAPQSYREFRNKQKEKARAGGSEGQKRIVRLVVFGCGITAAMLALMVMWFVGMVNGYRSAQVPPAQPPISASTPAEAGAVYEKLVHLQPDKSFQLAFNDIASLTGQNLQPPKLLPEATFPEKLSLLQHYAKECVAKAGIKKGDPVAPHDGSYATKALLDDLTSLDKRLGSGTISGAIAAQAAQDIARLDYIAPNSLGGNEPIVARALALAAIAGATGMDVNETFVTIASDVGYSRDAVAMAQKLPAGNPWRAVAAGHFLTAKDLGAVPAGDPTQMWARLHESENFWKTTALDEQSLSTINDFLERKKAGAMSVPNDDNARDIAESLTQGDYNAQQIARLQTALAAAPNGRLFDAKLFRTYFNTYFFGRLFDVADKMEYSFGSYDKIHELAESLGERDKLQPPAIEIAKLLDLRGYAQPISDYEKALQSPTQFGYGMRQSQFNHLELNDRNETHTRYGFVQLLKTLDATPLGFSVASGAAVKASDSFASQYATSQYLDTVHGLPKTVDMGSGKLPEAHKPIKATPAMLADAAQQAESWRHPDLIAYGDLLRDNGKLDEAYKVYERTFDRYNDNPSLSRMMGILWRQGKPDAAAEFFMDHVNRIDSDWSYNYGPEFADVFANNPEAGQKAFDWMVTRKGMFWSYYEGIAKNFAARGDYANAFKYQSQLTSATAMFEARNRLIAYDYLTKLKGNAEATRWLQDTIAKSPKLADTTQFAVPALSLKILEPLWTVLPLNPTDSKAALIWEARAAAEAAQPGLADKSGGHLKDLKAWADKADSPVAKYYLGMIGENDILNATAKDAVQMRLLTSAVGWKAESAGDFVKAAKWYAVAMNTGPQNIPDFVDLPVQRLQAMRDHFDFKKK